MSALVARRSENGIAGCCISSIRLLPENSNSPGGSKRALSARDSLLLGTWRGDVVTGAGCDFLAVGFVRDQRNGNLVIAEVLAFVGA